MSFDETQPHPFVPLDKMPAMNRVASYAIYWHSIRKQTLEKVKNAELEITSFLMKDIKDEMTDFTKMQKMSPEDLTKYFKEKDKDKDHPIIYAYAPENQYLFEQHLTEIEMESNSIPIVLNVQKEMNALPKRFEQQQQERGEGGNNVFIGQKDSFWKNPFNRNKKPEDNIADITSHSRSTDLMDRMMQVSVITTAYKHYHWQRVTDSLEFFRNKRLSQLRLLYIELVHYHSLVKPNINSAINEQMRLNLIDENNGIFSMLGRGQEAHERREMQPQFTPQQ